MAPTVDQRRADTHLELMHRGANRDPVVAVVKQHRHRAHFEHEVRWLTSAGHLPVARLEAVVAERLTIATRFNPSLTLADLAAEPPAALALLTELAVIVADLSVNGLIHGNLHIDHVLRDRRGGVFVVSPAPMDDPEADVAGLARCWGQVLDTADALALERGAHPWPDQDRQRWQELLPVLQAGGLGPYRAARTMDTLGQGLGGPGPRRLRPRLRFG